LPDEPFERDLLLAAPLLELRDLLLTDFLADFALAFAAFGFDEALDFDDDFAAADFARFGADRFFGLVFA
jgi:hypothetical protein